MSKENKNIPVKVGEHLITPIISIGGKGDRMIKQEGYVIFVPSDKEVGTEIEVEITRTLPNVGFAKEVTKELK